MLSFQHDPYFYHTRDVLDGTTCSESASLWGKPHTMAGKRFDFELTEENSATSSNAGQSGCKVAKSTQRVIIVEAKRLLCGMM